MGLIILRWIGAGLLAAAALYLSIINWIALIRRFILPRAPSWIPLIGGMLGAGAALLEPSGLFKGFWWAAFLVDGGSAAGLISTIVMLLLKTRPNQGPPR